MTRLIDADALKEAIKGTEYFNEYAYGFICDIIDNTPTVATERPQTIGCFNCKYEATLVCDEPCMVCNAFYSEWRQKE